MPKKEIKGFENISGFLFRDGEPKGKEGKVLRTAFSKAIKREKTLGNAFEIALSDSGATMAKKRAKRYLTSISGRMLATAQMNRGRKLDERLSLAECWALGRSLKVYDPIGEEARVFFKPKSSGGKRPIFDFDVKHRTAQRLIRQLLERSFSPKIWQYTLIGIHAAIANVKAIQPSNAVWAITLDIENFFGSFVDGELVKLLNFIPSDAVINVALTGNTPLTDMDGSSLSEPSLSKARSGVPQGSAVSPLIGAFAVSKLSLKLPTGTWFANYADDFLVIASTEEQIEIAKHAFASAISELPGGKFLLKEKQRASLDEGIVFLGHILRYEDGVLIAEPSPAAYTKLWDKTEELRFAANIAKGQFIETHSTADRTTTLTLIAEIYWLRLGWLNAFSECQEIVLKTVGDHIQQMIQELRVGTGIEFEELQEAKAGTKLEW